MIVVVKVLVVLAVIVAGAIYVNTGNWRPFIPANTGEFGEFGWSGILRGAGVIFFAYIGFDAVSTAAQEAKNPQKDMPIGILGSLVVCTILYVARLAASWSASCPTPSWASRRRWRWRSTRPRRRRAPASWARSSA